MFLEHAVGPCPELETERQRRVDELYLTSHGQDQALEKLVELTARCLKAPIAFVSILDNQRQWFLARVGLGIEETPRHQSFCVYAVPHQPPLQVTDASTDPRFRDNPLVTGTPGIRFYAGAPLITNDGLMLGSLCIIDTKPRSELDERRADHPGATGRSGDDADDGDA
ncbi:MAG: GAF domain-containing protein [Halopseudomonas sp.]|uniref:GAF domain-containing protein n=1 Tax=Halopseudomonas sp. TaxID=2901191 RepID=UPI0030016152